MVGCLFFMTYSVWSLISTVGYSGSAFVVAPRLFARLVSPKGVWCIWLSYSGGLFCGCPLFGFLLHAQISSYLHWALAFPVNWLIHWVFAYVSTWTGTLFSVPDSLCYEWFSSVPGAIAYFSKSPAIDLQCNHLKLYQIACNINTFLSHIIWYYTGFGIILVVWSLFGSLRTHAYGIVCCEPECFVVCHL